jgi:hypothetical protein
VSVTYVSCQVPTAKLAQLAFDITCLGHCTGISEARYCLRAGRFMSDAEVVIKSERRLTEMVRVNAFLRKTVKSIIEVFF